MGDTFGQVLRDWRTRRRLSQLDLALEADVSARHLSFLETGRARPSRGMVLRLSDVLAVPRAARNRLLSEAGYAPLYSDRATNAPDLVPLDSAIDRMLETHDPYPGIAIGHDWGIRKLNRAADALFGAANIGIGDNLVGQTLENPVLKSAILNHGEVIRHTLTRLRTEVAHYGPDPVRQEWIARILRDHPAAAEPPVGPQPAFIAIRYRTPLGVLSLFSTIAQFGSVEDISYADIQIELMHPADDASRTILEQLVQAAR
ncbi:helix-turn-helix domain-containing protein [Ponticoccus sp. SC2-23]|uniref:helix-turn-helix transcriptional regulator n=1 Tax=Alexandriicola marinus TaxID=2081710 RepID=UPI000FDA717E|nr:helix-turn-helix transcriptional regulator [Alexandriicola marinus]MBM1220100.1 helix-turn-helix domain-containing protein [Ponticoccus sp. SC6-9]MBM1224786.1 helix-turn-helix domain-containing protein [Ponticoccus sp. SC6-15]MBM1228299.1 helix-turn-helix domain-containing protein [Ponticoccus sp. SC6-38]MBM1234063.1 helix-turn-helix domain-containing protein [Ponticoccus sp. SC6-45]MBM1238801.1 helix-turn-helix domain-containing protein [Ponticoccus sp. SC6-49]MBM1242582.1 helix-turn-heli